MEFRALLFDTRSIQRYIYSSNKLRTNIGASYLVDQVFREHLPNILRQRMGEDQVDSDTWKNVEAPNWTSMDRKCRIAYIGGGNALALFRRDVEEDDIHGVVTEFTKLLLQTHPGLRTGAAYGTIRLDKDGHYLDENDRKVAGDDDNNCLTKLVRRLKRLQNRVFPEVNIPYGGLTQLCPELGETATHWNGELFCSWELAAKYKAGDSARGMIVDKLRGVLSKEESEKLFPEFDFSDDLGKLGQKETENYIAIVHIDGNNMGARFASCDTLTARKNLSLKLSRKTAGAFAKMLSQAMDEYDSYKNFLELKEGVLPVRPLVLGGDDLTFICTAKLALRYAKRVMEAMWEFGVDTCAGIAIQPTSYPFFRGYMLAEQTCDAAKKAMRALRRDDNETQSCWLDFVIRHGEQAPTLSTIREKEYKTRSGNMHFGPYRTDATEDDEKSLANLIAGLDSLKKKDYEKQRLAMGKIKKLRDVIRRDSAHEWEKFRQRMNEMDDSLPRIDAWRDYENELWKNGATPYIDLIEMLDFYEPEGGAPNAE